MAICTLLDPGPPEKAFRELVGLQTLAGCRLHGALSITCCLKNPIAGIGI